MRKTPFLLFLLTISSELIMGDFLMDSRETTNVSSFHDVVRLSAEKIPLSSLQIIFPPRSRWSASPL